MHLGPARAPGEPRGADQNPDPKQDYLPGPKREFCVMDIKLTIQKQARSVRRRAAGTAEELAMHKSQLASVEVSLDWASVHARHRDRSVFDKVDFSRDPFPGALGARLAAVEHGVSIREEFAAGVMVSGFDASAVRTLKRSQFRRRIAAGVEIDPHVGRFYPRGLVAAGTGDDPADRRPFRYLDEEPEVFCVDLNHPLAKFPVTVDVQVIERLGARAEHSGRCRDIGHDLADDGPGFQAALPDRDTDFFAGTPFARIDDGEDEQFYVMPRLVDHIDAMARAQVTDIYTRFLQPGMKVLDLMSSWHSHLPADVEDLKVLGLGMNEEELDRNEQLSARLVHDLNTRPELPFTKSEFDLALCTVSVEYLIEPFDVFREVARVLRPGGHFVVTFSDRWFPPKAIRLWPELHAFERIGLVIDYFRKSGGFTGLQTESIRGLARPADDQYARMRPHADPVFAVWGRAKPV